MEIAPVRTEHPLFGRPAAMVTVYRPDGQSSIRMSQDVKQSLPAVPPGDYLLFPLSHIPGHVSDDVAGHLVVDEEGAHVFLARKLPELSVGEHELIAKLMQPMPSPIDKILPPQPPAPASRRRPAMM